MIDALLVTRRDGGWIVAHQLTRKVLCKPLATKAEAEAYAKGYISALVDVAVMHLGLTAKGRAA